MEHYTNFTSSNVGRIGYDEDSETLVVKMKNGSTYHYYDVGSDVWESFKSASSKGSFVHRELMGNYRYNKI